MDTGIGTLSDGLAMALRMTSGYQEKCSKTARHLIDGLNLVEMGQLLDSSFPGVLKKFPSGFNAPSHAEWLMLYHFIFHFKSSILDDPLFLF